MLVVGAVRKPRVNLIKRVGQGGIIPLTWGAISPITPICRGEGIPAAYFVFAPKGHAV